MAHKCLLPVAVAWFLTYSNGNIIIFIHQTWCFSLSQLTAAKFAPTNVTCKNSIQTSDVNKDLSHKDQDLDVLDQVRGLTVKDQDKDKNFH